MSRSAPEITAAANPAKRRIEVKSKGIQEYVPSKVEGEKGTHKVHSAPFGFIVLDEVSCITGYSEGKKLGYYSNEIKDISKDYLLVRCGKDIVARGLYADIQEKVKAQGGKFTTCVYAVIRNGDGFDMVRIMLAGASVGAWFEFKRKASIYGDNAVIISGWKDDRKGAVEYKVPIFTTSAIKPDVVHTTGELDADLQSWLKPFLFQQQQEIKGGDSTDDGYNGDYSQDAGVAKSTREEQHEEYDAEDIPF